MDILIYGSSIHHCCHHVHFIAQASKHRLDGFSLTDNKVDIQPGETLPFTRRVNSISHHHSIVYPRVFGAMSQLYLLVKDS